jgi:antitoxin ParD1/3/4
MEAAMHLNLSSEMEQFLQSKVESGDYNNASEVVRDAIRRMKEDEKKVEALHATVKVSKDQIARGEYEVYTPELLDKITQRAFANAKAGKKIKPEVLPDDDIDSRTRG